MNMTFKTLQCEMLGAHILKIEMNRIEVSNAFNTEMAEDLMRCFETLAMNIHSPEQDIRVVILTGAGTKAFCAGGDLKERNGMSDDAWFSQHLVYERMVRAIMGCQIVIIGAINGAAYGGGCELVSMVDFAYAVPHARFAQTEVRLGIIPGAGGTQNLARAVGSRRAKELILTGAVFSADEAHEWGLINGVVPADQLLSVVTQKAEAIAANGPVAVRQAKMAIARAEDLSIADGLVFEIEAYNRCISTQDRHEGIAAFNEKRPPKFTGT